MISNSLLLEQKTKIRTEDCWTIGKLYNTDVVLFTDKMIVLNAVDPSGVQWYTWTTKRTMNLLAGVFGLNFRVYQKQFIWYVDYKNQTYEYLDNLILQRR